MAGSRSFWISVSFFVLLGMTALDLFVLIWIVPKFDQIFQDTLPGKPLPDMTNFFLGYRFLVVALALAWLIFCTVMYRRRNPHAILFINLGIVGTLIQIGILIIAMFMPMVGIINGMTDAPAIENFDSRA